MSSYIWCVFCFKQKTAYEMRISDWSSDVCSSDLHRVNAVIFAGVFFWHLFYIGIRIGRDWKNFKIFGPNSLIPGLQDLKDILAMFKWFFGRGPRPAFDRRSEEHTSELQSIMRISSAVFCLNHKKNHIPST